MRKHVAPGKELMIVLALKERQTLSTLPPFQGSDIFRGPDPRADARGYLIPPLRGSRFHKRQSCNHDCLLRVQNFLHSSYSWARLVASSNSVRIRLLIQTLKSWPRLL